MSAVEVPDELSLLLQRIVTTLPPETHTLVLRHLPKVELARLSCVHKAFHVAWRTLQEQQPGERYAPSSLGDIEWIEENSTSRLERAAVFGDVAVIRALMTRVDESGAPLLPLPDRDADSDEGAHTHSGQGPAERGFRRAC